MAGDLIPNVAEKTRTLPSVTFDKRPVDGPLSRRNLLLPLESEGVSRREQVDDLAAYAAVTGGRPGRDTFSVQRLDFYPEITVPLHTKYFNFTATAAVRATYYSNSFDDLRAL